MEGKDLLKKFWFVGLIALIFVCFIGYYAVDTFKNREIKVSTKQEDGKYLIYKLGDEKMFADDLYDQIKEGNIYVMLNEYLRAVANEAVKTTSDMSNYATSYASYYYQANGADKYKELGQTIKNYGYNKGIDDIPQYVIDSLKMREVLTEYFENNYDLVEKFIAEEEPKYISHILIKVADVDEVKDGDKTIHVANPTEEEKAKLDSVLEALNSKEFADVAKEFSEDTSKDNGGLLGVVTKTSANSYVTEFKEECLKLKPGEKSEVITTQYGYHIILCEALDDEKPLENADFFDALNTYYEKAQIGSVYLKGQELGFEIMDEELLKELETYKDIANKEEESEDKE